MSDIAVEQVEDGLHPSELVVTIRTSDGKTEEVAVDRKLLRNGRLKVYGVGVERDSVLVELPRETLSGAWRVWMPLTSYSSTEQVAAA